MICIRYINWKVLFLRVVGMIVSWHEDSLCKWLFDLYHHSCFKIEVKAEGIAELLLYSRFKSKGFLWQEMVFGMWLKVISKLTPNTLNFWVDYCIFAFFLFLLFSLPLFPFLFFLIISSAPSFSSSLCFSFLLRHAKCEYLFKLLMFSY